MFTYLCMLAEQVMPNFRKTMIGLDMVEYRRPDKQFVFMALPLPSVGGSITIIASVWEDTAARLGVNVDSTTMRIGHREVPVEVNAIGYEDRPTRIQVVYRCAELSGDSDDGQVPPGDVLRRLIEAMA